MVARNKWNVVLRTPAGARETVLVEAVTRTEAFALMKEKRPGDQVMNIESAEEDARPRRRLSAATAPSAIRGLIAGLLIIALAALATYLLYIHRGSVSIQRSSAPGTVSVTPAN